MARIPRECKRCHNIRRIVGRNLCNCCYKTLKKLNQLDLYPVRKGIEHFQEIRTDSSGNESKQCTICKEWKPLASFGRNPQSSIGYLSWCKECKTINSRERYAPKKKAIREARESVYQDGLKKCKRCGVFKPTSKYTPHPTHWDGLNHICKDCDNRGHDVYRQRHINRERASKNGREWYAKNKERKLKQGTEWRKNNPDKSRAIWHRYKSNKLKAEGDFTPEQWERVREHYCPDGLCLDCGKKRKLTYDHVIPLSKGGSNYIENIQPLCGNCNSKKSNHSCTDFRPDKGEFARSLMINAENQNVSASIGNG